MKLAIVLVRRKEATTNSNNFEPYRGPPDNVVKENCPARYFVFIGEALHASL